MGRATVCVWLLEFPASISEAWWNKSSQSLLGPERREGSSQLAFSAVRASVLTFRDEMRRNGAARNGCYWTLPNLDVCREIRSPSAPWNVASTPKSRGSIHERSPPQSAAILNNAQLPLLAGLLVDARHSRERIGLPDSQARGRRMTSENDPLGSTKTSHERLAQAPHREGVSFSVDDDANYSLALCETPERLPSLSESIRSATRSRYLLTDRSSDSADDGPQSRHITQALDCSNSVPREDSTSSSARPELRGTHDSLRRGFRRAGRRHRLQSPSSIVHEDDRHQDSEDRKVWKDLGPEFLRKGNLHWAYRAYESYKIMCKQLEHNLPVEDETA